MNRHTKLALIVAPFLAIGGYGASDYYLRNKSDSKEQLLKLELAGPCNLTSTICQLDADLISIKINHDGGETILNTSFPLDLATISFTNAQGTESVHHLVPDKFRLTWKAQTNFSELQSASSQPMTVRVGAIYSNLKYLQEFKTSL